MSDNVALAEDRPFEVDEIDARRAVVRFAAYVDHRRTPELEEQLTELLRTHQRVVCDVSACKTIDSDWLTLIYDLSLEAAESGKRCAVVGLSEVLEDSADILGLKKLDLAATIEEVWR